MAKLTTKKRNALPKSAFGEPGSRKYPMPDKAHAANAKARASQQVKKGNLSASEKAKIDAKADRKLGIKEGSKRDEKVDKKKGVDEYDYVKGMGFGKMTSGKTKGK